MALTVVKYRKGTTNAASGGETGFLIRSKISANHQIINEKPFIKLDGGSGLIINKIPAVIKPAAAATVPAAMKRSSNFFGGEPSLKSSKYSLQTIASTGTPLTSFQWQQTIGGGATVTGASTNSIVNSIATKKQLGAAISSLPPNTIIKATSSPVSALATNGIPASVNSNNLLSGSQNVTAAAGTTTVRRPTIFIKREVHKRTIQSVTMELIEKNPQIHIGVPLTRLPLFKRIICSTANVTLADCFLTLKKLKQNEDFSVLGEYFDMSETEAQQVFARSIVKMSRYLRYLIRWPDAKKYYERHKNLPFAFRQNLLNIQSLIECVETDVGIPPTDQAMPIDCSNYKYILCINTNGVITYISEAYIGHHDDLSIFNASNFTNIIPKYLSLVADPGKAIRRRRKPKSSATQKQSLRNSLNQTNETDSTTDSADETGDDDDDSGINDVNSHQKSNESAKAAAAALGSEERISKYTASRVAGELATNQTLSIVNKELTSRRVKNFTIPTVKVREQPVCRTQIRQMINRLQEFKILQAHAIQEPLVYQYLNEILLTCAALTNLQR